MQCKYITPLPPHNSQGGHCGTVLYITCIVFNQAEKGWGGALHVGLIIIDCYCEINCRGFLVCIKDWLLQLWVWHQYLQSVSGDLTLAKNYSSRTLTMNQRKVTKNMIYIVVGLKYHSIIDSSIKNLVTAQFVATSI